MTTNNESFSIYARENGKTIVNFETKDSIKIEAYTEKGRLTIEYCKWESEE